MTRAVVHACALIVVLGCGGGDGKEPEDTGTDEGTVDVGEEEPTLPPYCEADEDCDDGDQCSGVETCDTDTNTCSWGDRLEDGTLCSGDPRRICLSGRCRDSECGDGWVDPAAGEFCEQDGDPDCMEGCTYPCLETGECVDDDFCNGAESCSTTTHTCVAGTPVANGTNCGSPPRQICLWGTCVESLCNDGFIDRIGGEDCEGVTSQDCTVDCGAGYDGTQDCDWLCRWTACTAERSVNDECEGALGADAGGTFEGTTCTAGDDWTLIPSCCTDPAPDVVYSLTLGAEADVVISTCTATGFNTVLAVFSGTCDEFTEVACNDDSSGCGDGTQSRITTHLAAGDYLILVDGKELPSGDASMGDFTLTVTLP